MSYPKIAKLVDALLSQTESGALRWAQTEKSDMFQASFPRYSVRLYTAQGNTIEVDYVLQILNELGDIVEEVADPDLKSVMETPFAVMRRLHDAARRSAMGVETALDEILGFLDPLV